jgi:PPOX class probable F420-dependent enzyme
MVRLSPKQVQLINGRHFATVATMMPDGSPEATVVWIESDGELIYFNTAMHRLKARNLERDPRVAITIVDPDDPYDGSLAIRGRAELILEGADEHIEKLARAYTGKPFRKLSPDEVRVIVRVTPERVHVQ